MFAIDHPTNGSHVGLGDQPGIDGALHFAYGDVLSDLVSKDVCCGHQLCMSRYLSSRIEDAHGSIRVRRTRHLCKHWNRGISSWQPIPDRYKSDRSSMHSSWIGKALLAYQSHDEVEAIVRLGSQVASAAEQLTQRPGSSNPPAHKPIS